MKKISFFFTLLSFFSASAQTVPTVTSADIYLGLKKLATLGSVLYVGAHPDDENTRLLSYLAKDRLYRTGYLSLTRGDGGQNLIGNEQGIELGLIRTQELLAARRIDGAEQFFTRAYDFGFSKSPEETFTKWDKEKILADVVWVIRNFQPDVIITRFPTTGEGGHGHHTASAILANEAFTAAADPKRFPEQLKWVKPWQAKRIFWNAFNFGGNNTTRDDQLKIDVGGYNALLGKSYGEIAAESRSQHKSQGFGSAKTRGEALEYFKPTGGQSVQTDLLEGIITDWSRVVGGQTIATLLNATVSNFDLAQPQKIVPQLVQVYKAIKALPEGYWKKEKLSDVQELIENAGGLWLEATTTQPFVAQTDSVQFVITVNNRLGAAATLNGLTIDSWDTTFNTELAKNRNVSVAKKMLVPADKSITQPYWLQNKMEEGYFNVTDQQLIGKADVQPAYTALFNVTIEGEHFIFERPVKYKSTDPVKGELYQPFVVLPRVEVAFVNANNLSLNGEPVQVPMRFSSNRNDSAMYKMAYVYSKNWTADNNFFNYASYQNRSNFSSSTLKPVQKEKSIKEEIKATAIDAKGRMYDQYRQTITYDHIPSITYFPKATANLVNVAVKTLGKRIGYIVGAGDKVPEALEQMGYEVVMLSDKELARNNLQQYDAIISGVRAYNTDAWLPAYYDKLMQYVQQGGNLIVQYNTNNQLGGLKSRIGPYNFTVVNRRITDENAPVTFLLPEHPVLNYPNKITAEDFEGWIQERSIYHAIDFDKAFEAVLSMQEKGEAAETGSLITAKYGKGYFTYTGLVFFRELPAGVPGAYRLLANIIDLNRKKEL
jgi:LmbE family N-acetylglucosaminyl deacetylase